MSVTISWLINNVTTVSQEATGSSGVGFYGSGSFGASIQVGQYQENTYMTDSAGAVAGFAAPAFALKLHGCLLPCLRQ